MALGCSSLAIGLVGLLVVLAESDDPVREFLVSVLLAAFMAGGMWVLVTRRHLPGTPIAPPPESSQEPGTRTVRRVLVVQLGYAAVIALLVLFDPGPVGLVLGLGVWELEAAARLRRWERRHERRLLSEARWSAPREFYAV
jgi:hypothetical protein